MTLTSAPAATGTLETGTALYTDRYELTMLDAALADGTAQRPAVFEAFARKLPAGATFGVVAGVDRVVDAILGFRFNDAQLEWLNDERVVSARCLDWLADYRFGGDVVAYPDGELWGPNSPLVTVTGSFGEGVVLETVVLSILNQGCAVATEAARMRRAAGTAKLIEMGSRRTHEAAAVDAAAYAWMAGFDASSNLAAGARYAVATTGTAAHAWTLAHDDEADAFAAQMGRLGVDTTVLVDTYDIAGGIRAAVTAARSLGATGPGAVRLDSGDLSVEVPRSRALLDALGADDTAIVVSGDLDTATIAALEGGPGRADGYGVGTKLVSVAPIGAVYKLVAIADEAGSNWRPVAKTSSGKRTVGGVKSARRSTDAAGRTTGEVVTAALPAGGGTFGGGVARLLVVAGSDCRAAGGPAGRLAEARARCAERVASLADPSRTFTVTVEDLTQPTSERQVQQ